jgi:hypothetical protein
MANGKRGYYPVPDPTVNVRHELATAVKSITDMQRSAIRREDDLRNAHEELSKTRAEHGEKLARVRQWAAQETAKGQRREAKSESKRLNAVRKVDVAAGGVATATAERTAALLATQLAVTADTLRKQVETTATTQEQKLENQLNPMRIDLRELRELSSRSAGKESAAFDPLLNEMKALREDQAKRQGEILAATQVTAQARQAATTARQGSQFSLTTTIAAFYAIVATIGLIVLFATGHG